MQAPLSSSHIRQTRVQIWLPLILSILIILAGAVFAVLATGSKTGGVTVAKWSYLSTIFMLIPVFLFGFILLVIIAGLAYGVIRISQVLPFYGLLAQNLVVKFQYYVTMVSNKTVSPLLHIKGWNAGLRKLFGKRSKVS